MTYKAQYTSFAVTQRKRFHFPKRYSYHTPSTILLSRLARSLKTPISQLPHGLRRTPPERIHPRNIVPPVLHERHRRLIVLVLKLDFIWHQLIVQPALVQGLLCSHIVIQNMPELLKGGGKDPAASRGADNEVEAVVGGVLDDGGSDG
jgi:hypothetical protein